MAVMFAQSERPRKTIDWIHTSASNDQSSTPEYCAHREVVHSTACDGAICGGCVRWGLHEEYRTAKQQFERKEEASEVPCCTFTTPHDVHRFNCHVQSCHVRPQCK